METLGTLLTIIFTIASLIAGYNKQSIFKINLVQTVLIMIIGCFSQAERLFAYDGLSIWLVLGGLFIVVWVLVYIANKLCWCVGRIIRWMVDGIYTILTLLCISALYVDQRNEQNYVLAELDVCHLSEAFLFTNIAQ